MAIDQAAADEYINNLLQKFDKNPKQLDKHDRMSLQKYRSYLQLIERINSDMVATTQALRQTEARYRNLELQEAETRGKAQALIENLISIHFESDSQEAPPTPELNKRKRKSKQNTKLKPVPKQDN